MAATLTSASGMLALLDEPNDLLKAAALKNLDLIVDQFWADISAALLKIEALYDDDEFTERQLAASVASKVFYHLEQLDEALRYALRAGDRFSVEDQSQYAQTLVSKCIDEYIRLRSSALDTNDAKGLSDADLKIEPRLVAVVESMFARCFADRQFKQAIGVAIDSRRLDVVVEAIKASGQRAEMLEHVVNLARTVVSSRVYRHQILATAVKCYRDLGVADYSAICQSLLFLDDAAEVAVTLDTLLQSSDETVALSALQVAFDLHENLNMPFLMRVVEALPSPDVQLSPEQKTLVLGRYLAVSPAADSKVAPDMAAEAKANQEAKLLFDGPLAYPSRMLQLKNVLSGEIPGNLHIKFLYGHNRTDLGILTLIKEKLEPRNSVTHNAAAMAHALMQCGTTVDTFLASNLDWLREKFQNWAKFAVTASIGVVHKGHVSQSLKLLEPHLPRAGQAGSVFQEGGALYALGLIHSNHGKDCNTILEYLLKALAAGAGKEVVQHGACLGLGVAGMASNDARLYNTLKELLKDQNAVAGEAAAYAIGLVKLGSGDPEVLEGLFEDATNTRHDKIIRGLAMAIALCEYAREEAADPTIAKLMDSKDPLLRYGAMFAIGLAYCGSAHNGAVRKLLHVAVSDVSDDVRRGAVTCLGLVLCNVPEQVPRLVSLLSESYNPFVRCGACMAVGIACASTGNSDALNLLFPLLADRVDFVRQSAFIALSMVLIQVSAAAEPRVKKFRKAIQASVEEKKADTVTKFGAILSAGIIDGGGRNMNIALLSPQGHRRMAVVVGMAMFQQFWYWFPMVHMLSLAFTPTALVGLNRQLQMPKHAQFKSAARPSLFAYPPMVESKKEEKKKEKKQAVLSVSAKVIKRKEKKKGSLDESLPSTPRGPLSLSRTNSEVKLLSRQPSLAADPASALDGKVPLPLSRQNSLARQTSLPGEPMVVEPEEPKEALFELLENPSRVTREQAKVVSFPPGQRYAMVKRKLNGFVLLRDCTPDAPEDVVLPKAPK